ncbi:cell wall elongation regulator TseB-like domain-containing protein [Streptococcus dentiloxodontae]
MKEQGLTPLKQVLIGSVLIIIAVIVSITSILVVSTKPYRDAKKETTQLAARYAKVSKVTDFTIYNGKATYYSVLGITSKKQGKAVIVNSDTGAIDVYNQSDGITANQAKTVAQSQGAKKISEVKLGMYDDTPIWEVKAGTKYYLVGFISGHVLKIEGQ